MEYFFIIVLRAIVTNMSTDTTCSNDVCLQLCLTIELLIVIVRMMRIVAVVVAVVLVLLINETLNYMV